MDGKHLISSQAQSYLSSLPHHPMYTQQKALSMLKPDGGQGEVTRCLRHSRSCECIVFCLVAVLSCVYLRSHACALVKRDDIIPLHFLSTSA
jgi:hypothetical protein